MVAVDWVGVVHGVALMVLGLSMLFIRQHKPLNPWLLALVVVTALLEPLGVIGWLKGMLN